MDKLKQCPAEDMKEVIIHTVLKARLDTVFDYLVRQDPKKEEAFKNKIGHMDIARVLQFLGCKPSKSEVKMIIWEVDDDLDGYVNLEEYYMMYKRCTTDTENKEPRKLFNLVQFLMYDKEFKGSVTVEETLQILFVRHGRDRLDAEIRAIFGDDEDQKDADGVERAIQYSEYLDKINARGLTEFKIKQELHFRKRLVVIDNSEDN